MNAELRIRWAPKVRRAKIRRLYQTDALGLLDEALIEEVGFALLQRCESILMVTEARRLPCPQCGAVIDCPAPRWRRGLPILCPACAWQATYGQWRDSWRHQDLTGGNALPAFRAFVEQYPQAAAPRTRLLLIDRLIHAFHWSARRRRFHAPAAAGLIEGDLEAVMAFLDELTHGTANSSDLQQTGEEWKRTLEQVAETFPFVRQKLEARGVSVEAPPPSK
jgi:predicted RNA-binding Zn-ribbon protein involved in translation (DUF1610 family)